MSGIGKTLEAILMDRGYEVESVKAVKYHVRIVGLPVVDVYDLGPGNEKHTVRAAVDKVDAENEKLAERQKRRRCHCCCCRCCGGDTETSGSE